MNNERVVISVCQLRAEIQNRVTTNQGHENEVKILNTLLYFY